MAKAEPGQARKCPGERYDISLAICLARQANQYPKCLLCQHHAQGAPEAQAGDPKVKATIFRTTSISGRVPGEINEYVIRKIGTAAAQYLRAESGSVSSLVSACDMRENSRNLSRIFCEGASAGGLHTVSIGVAMPEVLRFVLANRKLGAAAFISGCHAAENVNGIRLCRHTGAPITFDSGLDMIGLIARRLKPGRARAPGQRETLDPTDEYRSYVAKFAPKLAPFKIVVDASCGIAGRTVPYVFDKLPVTVVRSNCECDGRSKFLGHRFPPAEITSSVASAVRSSGARLGAAIDFDGDIIAFCDEKGSPLRNDVVATLIARELLARTPGARVAHDLRFTGMMREEVLRAGGQAVRTAADPLAPGQAIRQKEAIYAADVMGRHFFRDMFGAESPVLALLMMCSLVSRRQEPLSKLASEVMRYSHSGELRYDMPSTEVAQRAMAEVEQEFREANRDALDGLTCRFPEWWFNLRRPHGSAVLRLNVEGRTPSTERRGRQMVERLIKKHMTRKSA